MRRLRLQVGFIMLVGILEIAIVSVDGLRGRPAIYFPFWHPFEDWDARKGEEVTYFSAGESATAASVVSNRKVKLSCR